MPSGRGTPISRHLGEAGRTITRPRRNIGKLHDLFVACRGVLQDELRSFKGKSPVHRSHKKASSRTSQSASFLGDQGVPFLVKDKSHSGNSRRVSPRDSVILTLLAPREEVAKLLRSSGDLLPMRLWHHVRSQRVPIHAQSHLSRVQPPRRAQASEG